MCYVAEVAANAHSPVIDGAFLRLMVLAGAFYGCASAFFIRGGYAVSTLCFCAAVVAGCVGHVPTCRCNACKSSSTQSRTR